MTDPETSCSAHAYDAPALRKGIRLLELLCEATGPLSVAQLSHRLGLNKHMILRLLGTLCDEGWVVQEEGPVYRLSLVPLHHLSKPVSRMDVVAAAEEPIAELWETTGEATYMSICDGDRSMGVLVRQTQRDVQVAGRIGARLLMHCCAPGKVLLAFGDPQLFERLTRGGFARQTGKTIADPVELAEHLKLIVRQGYATDDEEYLPGMICLAGPVFDYTGRVVASIGITTLTLYHTHDSMVTDCAVPVLAACQRVSLTLGGMNHFGDWPALANGIAEEKATGNVGKSAQR